MQKALEAAELAEWGLSYFTRLTALQRSSASLKDVLSYSLEEISEILDTSVPSIRGALHRGRAILRRGVVDDRLAILARERPGDPPSYCVFVRFRDGRVQAIRDYRYARHVFAEASARPADSWRTSSGPPSTAAASASRLGDVTYTCGVCFLEH